MGSLDARRIGYAAREDVSGVRRGCSRRGSGVSILRLPIRRRGSAARRSRVFLCPRCGERPGYPVRCQCGYAFIVGGNPRMPEREAGFLDNLAEGFSPNALRRTARAYGGQLTPNMKMAAVMREGGYDFAGGRELLLRYGEARPEDQFDRGEIEWLLKHYSEWVQMRRLMDNVFVGIGISV